MKLWDYQKIGVDFLRKRSRAILADEMGVGKTCQAIVAAGTSKTLVVCPASVIDVWQNELDQWAHPKLESTITSYGRAKHFYDVSFGTIILDEAHYVKNRKALRSKTIASLIRFTKPARVWMLTGTPLLNDIGELWNLLNILEPWKRGRYWNFLEKYSHVAINEFGGWEYKGIKDPRAFRESTKDIWLRRLKKDVLKDLPALSRQFLTIKTPKNIDEIEDLNSEKGFLRYQYTTFENKIDTVNRLLSQVSSFVVFCHHRDIARSYAEILGATLITGELNVKKRAKLVATKPKKIVATIDSCGVGISFAQCSYCVFAELEYVPSKLIQAEARLHRPGQKNAVNSYFLVTPLDYRRIQVLREKDETISHALDEQKGLEI